MKLFITKFGILRGIYEVDACPTSDEKDKDGTVFFKLDPRQLTEHAARGQYASTEEEARRQVAEMVTNRIADLKEQIKKLESYEPVIWPIKKPEF